MGIHRLTKVVNQLLNMYITGFKATLHTPLDYEQRRPRPCNRVLGARTGNRIGRVIDQQQPIRLEQCRQPIRLDQCRRQADLLSVVHHRCLFLKLYLLMKFMFSRFSIFLSIRCHLWSGTPKKIFFLLKK